LMVKVQRLFAKTNLKIPVYWRGHVFFSPTHPFKNSCTPQGHTPLAAARGLAALHPARRATAN
ncbi:hypothetical protein, partial [Gemmiger formicilis]|uniref:hypothetical protein n=1 Tax=Gemmiger formicilis TaxID=745368 RepID=UPI002432A7DF